MNTPCERMIVFEKTSGRYDLGGWAVKDDANERQTLRNRFPDRRLCTGKDYISLFTPHLMKDQLESR